MAKIDRATIKLTPGVHVFNQNGATLINLETHDTRQICVVFVQRRQKKGTVGDKYVFFFRQKKCLGRLAALSVTSLLWLKWARGGSNI